jgi:hypothetical protein
MGYSLAKTSISCQFRPRQSAWKNSRDSLIFEGLHENWTLALRFRASGVSSEKARADLTPRMELRQNGTVFLMIKLAASMVGPGLNRKQIER